MDWEECCNKRIAKEVSPDESLISDRGTEFDELRKARNAVTYYGEELTTEEASELIDAIKKLRTSLLDLFDRQIG